MSEKKHILISNIGNRNILYKGITYPTFSRDARVILGSFREWTKKLLANFEEEKAHLQLNIIDTLIEEKKEQIAKIYLFYSDHEAGQKNDQDTVYEAEIMQKLIASRYGIPTEIKKVKAVVIDNNGLLRYYRNAIRMINKMNEQPYFIVCDAGGTPQQKSALKIILEYTIPVDRYEVQYVNYGKLQKIEPIEYRNIINVEQATILMQIGQYYSAIKLLGFDSPETANNQKDKNFKLLAHLYFRFNGNYKDAKHLIHNKLALESPLLEDYIKMNAASTNQGLKNLLSPEPFLLVIEKFYKALFFFRLRNWSFTILALSQFYEEFFNVAIPKQLPLNLTIDQYFKTNYQNFIQAFNQLQSKKSDHYRVNPHSTALLIMLGKLSTNATIKAIANLLCPYFNYTDDYELNSPKPNTLNGIRNKVAHNGLLITDQYKNQELPYLDNLMEQIGQHLQLTKTDLFAELNDFLASRIRNA